MFQKTITVPKGRLAATEEELRKLRGELREMLLESDCNAKITQSGDEKKDSEVELYYGNATSIPRGEIAMDAKGKPGDGNIINVPRVRFAADAAAEERKKIREALLKGDSEVKITQSGNAKPASEVKPGDGNTINVPKGKLAASMYWYENDPDLYREEVAAMNRQFPQFELKKLSDGRLCWIGTVKPTSVRENASWMLMLVYDHNHPSNNNWGGSVRVYVIDPDLDELNRKLGGIPHLLRDPSGNIHLCTARKEDVKTGRNLSTSAVASLAWAIKWICVFELWLAGDVTTDEFRNHTF